MKYFGINLTLDDFENRLDDAVQRGELTEQEASDELTQEMWEQEIHEQEMYQFMLEQMEEEEQDLYGES